LKQNENVQLQLKEGACFSILIRVEVARHGNQFVGGQLISVQEISTNERTIGLLLCTGRIVSEKENDA
jgi:hypothetical protein